MLRAALNLSQLGSKATSSSAAMPTMGRAASQMRLLSTCSSGRISSRILLPAATRAVPVRNHCDSPVAADAKDVKFSFVNKDGKEFPVTAKVGQNLVQVAHAHEVELEGACECSLACSTCHIVLKNEVYDGLEPATDEEEDLLDLAFGLTNTSRLGCQVKVTESFEGTKITLPAATRNFYVDGHKPQPH